MGYHESYAKTPVGKKWSYTSSYHYDLTPTEKLLKYSNFIFAFAIIYVSMTFVSVIVQGAGVGIAVEQISTLKDGVNRTFYEMVENYADYNFEENSTAPIDYMQSTLECCGLYEGYGDWNATSKLATEWIKLHAIDTPDSCCIKDKIKTRCGFGQARPLENSKDRIVYKTGCADKFYSWIDGKVSSVTVIAIANIVCQLTSATFLFLLRQSMQVITF
ncbi:tetraspanin-5-like [Bolinopsis microptera]|uniref:tetraspanin-5-like n=1 Tax=Bolinopsis microptera TaxID=2820187 RepID=UPI003079F308